MASFGGSGVDGRKACNKSRMSKELHGRMSALGSASISESLNANFMEMRNLRSESLEFINVGSNQKLRKFTS